MEIKKKHGITKKNLNKTDQKFQNSTNTGQHDEFNLRPSRKCTQLSVSSLQKTISRLCISMLFCDETLRSSFATCVSRGLKTVVTRHRQNNPMAGILFSKEIIYRKNGSTVFNIFHGRPQIFGMEQKTVCTSGSFENHLFLAHKAVLMLRRSGKMDGNVRCDKI